MTPLEQSRFAAESANETPSRPDEGQQGVDSVRQNVLSHHGWTSGVGDCCCDCTSCWSVIICAPTIMGQLTEKMWPSSTSVGPFKYTCFVVAGILWCGAFGSLIVNYYIPPCSGTDMNFDGAYDEQDFAFCEGAYYKSGLYIIASILAAIFGCGMCVLTTLVRSYIRKRDSIPATCMEGLDDIACACCCLPCVQCQLMRHEGMTSGRYSLASSDGSAEMV